MVVAQKLHTSALSMKRKELKNIPWSVQMKLAASTVEFLKILNIYAM